YFVGFLRLLHDGADYPQVDRAMEAFGWPMGPAYLQDVVGMDTSSHVFDVIAAGYPQRMQLGFSHVLRLMTEHKRYGQKSGAGFYRYEASASGKPVRLPAPEAQALVATAQPAGPKPFGDAEIVDRLMLPMIVEAAICLEEGIAQTAADIDLSLTLGLGFPRQLGGALKYADQLGLSEVVERCARYERLGAAYAATAAMRAMAARGARFYAN
ncbi:MAG: 3-hydroxyacyl-CoA dehydrogenase family protein, partial [Gammaproteobacteria bacterium]